MKSEGVRSRGALGIKMKNITSSKFIVGIDEVGRGPLAGPVTVCVVACEEKTYKILRRNKLLPKGGKDSKKLKAHEREKFEKALKLLAKGNKISFSVQHVSNKIIDTKGISFSIKKALSRGISRLRITEESLVLLDGGLKAPQEFKFQKTIIRGDEKEKIIAWASILAKVSRDSLMRKIAKKLPQYGFEEHKGYGTLQHRKALRKHGLSPMHRLTFCRKY